MDELDVEEIPMAGLTSKTPTLIFNFYHCIWTFVSLEASLSVVEDSWYNFGDTFDQQRSIECIIFRYKCFSKIRVFEFVEFDLHFRFQEKPPFSKFWCVATPLSWGDL